MIKNPHVSFILLLLLFVTAINLFYKRPATRVYTQAKVEMKRWLGSLLAQSTCSVYGFKCPEEESCDCDAMCGGQGKYLPFRVVQVDDIYVGNRKLDPGTYCLPKGAGACDQAVTYAVFSQTGWKCVERHEGLQRDACKSDEAADNSSNVLWDYQNNEPAGTNLDNPYEVMTDGNRRYRCNCSSRDLNGNRMVNVLPWVCSVDYCVREIPGALQTMGFNGSTCDCGPYPKGIDGRCVNWEIKSNELSGSVPCTNSKSRILLPINCPDENTSTLTFSMTVTGGYHPHTMLAAAIQ